MLTRWFHPITMQHDWLRYICSCRVSYHSERLKQLTRYQYCSARRCVALHNIWSTFRTRIIWQHNKYSDSKLTVTPMLVVPARTWCDTAWCDKISCWGIWVWKLHLCRWCHRTLATEMRLNATQCDSMRLNATQCDSMRRVPQWYRCNRN